MQYVYSPWRFDYVSTAAKQTGCIFCAALEDPEHSDTLILHRADRNFLILNRYPYNNGHLMIAPYRHIASPADADAAELEEMMRLFQRSLHALKQVYGPDGFNMGMNLGRCAGAGVENHYHLHIVPRWNGDTNFMSTLAETRVLPEDFAITLAKLKPYFVQSK